MRRGFLPVLLCLALTACASNSQERLAKETGRLVKAGMPARQAQAALTSAGFHCGHDYTGGRGDLICDRDRSYYLVAGCVQRVRLWFDPSKQTLDAFDVPQPNCAGL